MRLKTYIKTHPLACWMMLLIIVKAIIAGGLAINAFAFAIHDDALMVDMAGSLLRGEWLGVYNDRILTKGITFPVFLALNHLSGVPYTVAVVVLFGLACALLTFTVGKFIKKQAALAAFFAVMYFTPVNGSMETLTRVYRNSLLPILSLTVFACLVRMYLCRGKKGFVFWGGFAGLAIAAFWNLREDSIWLAPLIGAVCVVTALSLLLEYRRKGEKWLRASLLCAFIPVFLLFVINTGIRSVNYTKYGVFIRNELQEGSFPKLIRALNAVQLDTERERLSIPKNTIDQAYSVSPTFAKLKPYLDLNYGAGWDATDGKLDGQIDDGWFFWCLRDCIFNGGFVTNAQDMEVFCAQAASEINAALADGRIKRTSLFLMPSAMLSPWRASYASSLPSLVNDVFWATASHYGCRLSTEGSGGDGIEKFEAMTHNFAVMPISPELSLAGWIVSNSDSVSMELAVYQGDSQLIKLNKSGGEDVFQALAASGRVLENARNCRFETTISIPSTDDLWLNVLQDGQLADRVPLNENTYSSETDEWTWVLDRITIGIPSLKNYIELTAQPRMAVLQTINNLYQSCGTIVTIVGLVCYFSLTVLMLLCGFRKKNWHLLDGWLIMTGLWGSVVVLCGGIAYNHLTSCPSIAPIYLGGGFTLMTAANLTCILLAVSESFGYFGARKRSLNNRC